LILMIYKFHMKLLLYLFNSAYSSRWPWERFAAAEVLGRPEKTRGGNFDC